MPNGFFPWERDRRSKANHIASQCQTAHSRDQQEGRVDPYSEWEECVVTSVVSDALRRVEAPGEGRAFMQRFDVTYEYPVYFTRDVFAEQNAVLAEAIMRLRRLSPSSPRSRSTG
jgi:hypothetical protein